MGNYLVNAVITTRMTAALCEALTGLTGADHTTELDAIIVKQENIVEGYVANKYDVPLTSPEGIDMAEEWTFALCQYELHTRGAGDDVQTKVRDQYKDAMQALRDVSRGKLVIPGEEPPGDTTMGLYIDSRDVELDWDDDAEDTY